MSKEHFVCLTGNFRLHVPRIGWILCHCDHCIWPLLFRFATYPNSNVPNPQLPVGERITTRLLGNVDAKENSDDSFIIQSCVALIDFSEKLSECLSSCLPGKQQSSVVSSYGPEEFEKTLALPTSQIIERHDFRTILDFLLMKLRTALDRDWLKKLPLLHKVIKILYSF